jgi:hypothetical protein
MLMGRDDNAMPESTISPSQGSINLAAANNTSILSPPCLHFAHCQIYSGFGKKRNLLLVKDLYIFRFQRTESAEYNGNFPIQLGWKTLCVCGTGKHFSKPPEWISSSIKCHQIIREKIHYPIIQQRAPPRAPRPLTS